MCTPPNGRTTSAYFRNPKTKLSRKSLILNASRARALGQAKIAGLVREFVAVYPPALRPRVWMRSSVFGRGGPWAGAALVVRGGRLGFVGVSVPSCRFVCGFPRFVWLSGVGCCVTAASCVAGVFFYGEFVSQCHAGFELPVVVLGSGRLRS